MPFFKQSELIKLAKQKGDTVEMCQMTTIPGNVNYNIPSRQELVCETIIGHIGRRKLDQIPLRGTTGDYPSGDTVLYVNNVNGFDPTTVEPSTRFRVNGNIYKVESTEEAIRHQGIVVYYVYSIVDDKEKFDRA